MNRLRKVCEVTDGNDELTVYGTDASRIKGNAALVAWPQNADNLQKLIRHVTKEKIGMTIRGGGTSLVGSAVPQNTIVVDMSHFNKIRQLNMKDETITAEAGVVLDTLNDVLNHYGYEVTSKPGSHAAATIGGMIATNAAGMLSSKYGRFVEQVVEMNIMDGTGKSFTIKGDEIKEFAGTEGAVAVVLDAKIKINRKLHLFDAVFEFNDIKDMIVKFNELKNDSDVVAIEHINKTAAKISKLKYKDYLLVKYTVPKGNIDSMKFGELWKLRENLYSVLVNAGFQRIEDPLIPQENIEKFLNWLENRNIPCYDHISSGIFHPHFRRNQKKDTDDMMEAVKQLSGKHAAEHGIGILKKDFASVFMQIRKIQSMKKKYDPFNMLNRGKFR
jgi:FAD/FMN-containing dehydrogenase